jgi:hypothetical protein
MGFTLYGIGDMHTKAREPWGQARIFFQHMEVKLGPFKPALILV